jgi:hypothetical protein
MIYQSASRRDAYKRIGTEEKEEASWYENR